MDPLEFSETVARLRRQGTDDGRCEVKSCSGGLGSDVWDSVSAFANSRSGHLVLGLSERDGFRPAVGFELDVVLDQFVTGIGDGGATARLINPPSYDVERAELDGRAVLVIEIHENAVGHKPCSVRAKGIEAGSYKRVDDKDIRLSSSEIFEMRQALLPQESDQAVVPEADGTDLDPDLVQSLLRARASTRAVKGTDSDDAALRRLSVLSKTDQVRLAGLLSLGNYPQQFYPRLFIDVTVHPTNEKSSPTTGVRFLDRVTCDGPLAEAVENAVDAVARNLRTYSVVEGVARTDQLEIPEDVLREAIANAVVHREYHPLFCGQPVTVDIYPDRVEIANPGGLWGGKTVDNLDNGTSRCRNQLLMQVLKSVPFRSGNGVTAEGQGSGVRLMINQMQAQALDTPSFRASADQVTVVLRRHGAEVPALRRWLRELGTRALTPHEDAALVMARRHGTVDVERLHSDMRIDSDEARDLLRTLSAAGLLHNVGPEQYALVGDTPEVRSVDQAVLDVLSTHRPRHINDIAAELDKPPNTLRPILRRLVETGLVEPTAPPTSRHRRYLRAL